MFTLEYFDAVKDVLEHIYSTQVDKIQNLGSLMADTLEHDGLIHAFGCGHSHIIAEELFYRAGGLAAINPLFETSAMLHEGATKSSMVERMQDYAPLVIEGYDVRERDCFIIASSSGINSFPIEMALEAKKRGATVIGITSCDYDDEPSREKHGYHLRTVCDHYVNNFVPRGDATVQVLDDGVKAGPVSTIATMFIGNSLMLAACEELKKRGCVPEIFMSANVSNGSDYNEAIIQKYRGRIKHL